MKANKAWEKILKSKRKIRTYLTSSIDNLIMLGLVKLLFTINFNRYVILDTWIDDSFGSDESCEEMPSTNRFRITNSDSNNRYLNNINNGILRSELVIAFYPYDEYNTLQEIAIANANEIPIIYICPYDITDGRPLVIDNYIDLDGLKFNYDLGYIHKDKEEKLPPFKEYVMQTINSEYEKGNYQGGIVINNIRSLLDILV